MFFKDKSQVKSPLFRVARQSLRVMLPLINEVTEGLIFKCLTRRYTSVLDSFTVTNDSNVISTPRKLKIVKGQYGCQSECKNVPYSTHMRQIVMVLGRAKVAQLISKDFLYCSGCSYAFHPDTCQGNKRKICPCCTVRLALLKTVLKRSTVKKIQDTVLIHRVE